MALILSYDIGNADKKQDLLVTTFHIFILYGAVNLKK